MVNWVLKLVSESTEEEAGLRLSIPVKQIHIDDFKYEAKRFYKFCEYKPRLNIKLDIETPKSLYLSKDYFLLDDYSRVNYVLMSNVLYTIPSSNLIDNKGFDSLVLKVPNGNITYAPNRETLVLDEPTVEYINKAFEHAYQDIISSTKKALQNTDNIYEYIKLFNQVKDKTPYSISNNLNLDYKNKLAKLFKPRFNKVECSIPNIELYNWPHYYKSTTLKPFETVNLSNLTNNAIIIVDVKTRFKDVMLQLREEYQKENGNKNFAVFKSTDELSLKQLKETLTEEGFIYKVVSDYIKPKISSNLKRKYKSIKPIDPYVNNYNFTNDSFSTGKKYNPNFTYLYVPLVGFKSKINNMQSYSMLLNLYGQEYDYFFYNNKLYKVSNCKIVGVQKKYQKLVKNHPNFLPLTSVMDVLVKGIELNTIPPKELTILDRIDLLPSLLQKRVEELRRFSKKKFIVNRTQANKIKEVYSDISHKVYDYSNTTDELNDKYPLLVYSWRYYERELKHYLKLEYYYEQQIDNKAKK